MSPEQPTHTIVLARVVPGERRKTAIPGTSAIKADCGCRCWITVSSLQAHLDKTLPTVLLCMQHAGVDIEDLPEMAAAGRAKMLPGQTEELNQHWGPERTKRFLKATHLKENL